MPILPAAFLAGAMAIVANMLALAAAKLIPLATAHGGLLRLLTTVLGVAAPKGAAFQAGFHIFVGLAMAVFYGYAVEPFLTGPAWFRGLVYGSVAWLANAAIVLPLTGEGFAGSNDLPISGMAWFAAAHLLYFVLQAVLFSHLRHSRPKPTDTMSNIG